MTKLSNASFDFKLDCTLSTLVLVVGATSPPPRRYVMLSAIVLLDTPTYLGLERQIGLHAQLHASLVKPCKKQCRPSQAAEGRSTSQHEAL